MNTNLIYSCTRADDSDILEAENRIGNKLPNSYVNFCKRYDGAKLKNAKTSALKGREYEIRQFIPSKVLGVSNIEAWDTNLIAFAEDSGGNFFVFKKPDLDTVYFWDHETDKLELLCGNFDYFLSVIEEFSTEEVVIPEDAEVWINPAFLKKQKDLGNA